MTPRCLPPCHLCSIFQYLKRRHYTFHFTEQWYEVRSGTGDLSFRLNSGTSVNYCTFVFLTIEFAAIEILLRYILANSSSHDALLPHDAIIRAEQECC